MVVDASAILAILLDEPDAEVFSRALIESGGAMLSPVNHWEVLVRANRHEGEFGRAMAEALLVSLNIQVATLDADQSRRATDAFVRFGKGVGGLLNLGDCFAYALAETHQDGLLFKGDDFPRTDVKSAL